MPEGLLLLDPWFLLLAPVVLLALAGRLVLRPPALAAASLDVPSGLPRTLRQRCVHLPVVLLALAGVALSVALARPASEQVVEAEEDALDILLVVDISSSMGDPDVGGRKTRLESAMARARDFVERRPDDRIGLLTFNGFAELRCPPTGDHAALGAFLAVVDVTPRGAFEDGTAIGVAVAECGRLLEETPGDPVCLLLTDGMNTVRDVAPAEAAKLTADAGVRVHTIGFGPDIAVHRPAQADLAAIAEATGGEFFVARDDAALDRVYDRIDELETVPVADPIVRTEDLFFWPMAVGLALVMLALLSETLWIRRAP